MVVRTAYSDLALRDEYLDYKLRTAARDVWLAISDPLQGDDLQPSDQWIQGEADSLRELLHVVASGEPEPPGRWWELRLYILRNLGVLQSYASSSARVERVTVPGF